MAIELRRESAKIYKFPSMGRRSLDRTAVRPMTVEEFEAQRQPVVDHGAWYHAAAIDEERQH